MAKQIVENKKNARIQKEKQDAKVKVDYLTSLGDFPDGETKRKAEALGSERYAALKLLNDTTVIQNYCHFRDAGCGICR